MHVFITNVMYITINIKLSTLYRRRRNKEHLKIKINSMADSNMI